MLTVAYAESHIFLLLCYAECHIFLLLFWCYMSYFLSVVAMLNTVMLNIAVSYCCRDAECCYAECHYAGCRYAEGRSASKKLCHCFQILLNLCQLLFASFVQTLISWKVKHFLGWPFLNWKNPPKQPSLPQTINFAPTLSLQKIYEIDLAVACTLNILWSSIDDNLSDACTISIKNAWKWCP